MRLRAILLATAALMFVVGCEGSELCDADCPDITGIYSVRVINQAGACSFNALTVGPSVVLQQSEDRRRVFAELIDPRTDLPVVVTADVTRLEDDEGGSFSGSMQLPSRTDPESANSGRLWVLFSGTVNVVDGQRHLGASLTTQSLDDACTESLYFSGDGPFVP